MIQIGLLLFPRLTQLDLTGPFEVLTRMPDTTVHLLWKTTEPITSDAGLALTPTTSFADTPQLDVLLVPGGYGVSDLLLDDEVLTFLRAQAAGARFTTAVCTGSLVLGAAGLLDGYRATTHWAYHDLLAPLGATPVEQRVVVDRDRITGGGITAGIDAALRIAALLADEATASAIELQLEYHPAPPFGSGHPSIADPALVAKLRTTLAPNHERRRALVEQAAARLTGTAGAVDDNQR
jgi:cyclohexyl-isocyanide hydratase